MDTAARFRRVAPWLALAAILIVLDQATKLLVLARFADGESIRVTSFFNLVLVYNKGAAFSFLAGADGWQTPLLVVIALTAIAIVGWMLWRNPSRRLLDLGLAMILGGAIGNLVDRVAYGKVVDFLHFHLYGWNYPAFNVADSAITVGAVILIVESFMPQERAKAGGEAKN
jgi:signal peptidase II